MTGGAERTTALGGEQRSCDDGAILCPRICRCDAEENDVVAGFMVGRCCSGLPVRFVMETAGA